MSTDLELEHNPCIVAGIQPLLTELRQAVSVHFRAQHDSDREPLESFIRHIFQRSYGAALGGFYPNLTAFSSGGEIRGVVGYRSAAAAPLFCEHYLDEPVETVAAARLDQTIERRHMVEVGNLALTGLGEARWAIAAMTVFLHAAGYRWVVFTAVKPLINAFQRLGLRPIQIAVPDPGRLPDAGRQWGSYYQAGPLVCAGNIEAGYRKLSMHVSQRQPRLQALLQDARRLGLGTRPGGIPGVREAG
ncbi:MAG: thermostable hemolysin [Thiogranum sp.]